MLMLLEMGYGGGGGGDKSAIPRSVSTMVSLIDGSELLVVVVPAEDRGFHLLAELVQKMVVDRGAHAATGLGLLLWIRHHRRRRRHRRSTAAHAHELRFPDQGLDVGTGPAFRGAGQSVDIHVGPRGGERRALE